MLIFVHRVNSIEQLSQVPQRYGVEVDVRAQDDDLILAHDPYQPGERLEDYLRRYRHAGIIFNIKCDGLEDRILGLAREHGIESCFLLDVANPTLVKLALEGERRVAVRFSEHEPIEGALAFAGKVDWVWVDCFTRLPLDRHTHRRLAARFKICLVSPELQRHPRARIPELRRQLEDLPIDAVCTDFPEDWS